MSDAVTFRRMTAGDLDAVLKIEYAAFSHPWTRGIFQDSLNSYDCWVMFEGEQQVGHGVINVIIDEAHLLNITVKPESQGRGLGLRDKGDWLAFAGYKYIEPDAMPDGYNDSSFHLGGTNARGYFLGAAYAFEKNVYGQLRWSSSKEVYGAPLSIDVLQLELNARF